MWANAGRLASPQQSNLGRGEPSCDALLPVGKERVAGVAEHAAEVRGVLFGRVKVGVVACMCKRQVTRTVRESAWWDLDDFITAHRQTNSGGQVHLHGVDGHEHLLAERSVVAQDGL